jgi:type VI secretion system protein VasD
MPGYRQTRTSLAALLLATSLSACGAWQYIKDTGKELGSALFHTRLKTMKLDLSARAALNPDDKGQSLSVVVRIYQLQDGKTFHAASYEQLLADDKAILGDALVARKDVVLAPSASISLTEALDERAGQVGVIALFRTTDKASTWRISLPRSALDNDTPARLEAKDSQLIIDYLPHPPPQPATEKRQYPTLPDTQRPSKPVTSGKGV